MRQVDAAKRRHAWSVAAVMRLRAHTSAHASGCRHKQEHSPHRLKRSRSRLRDRASRLGEDGGGSVAKRPACEAPPALGPREQARALAEAVQQALDLPLEQMEEELKGYDPSEFDWDAFLAGDSNPAATDAGAGAASGTAAAAAPPALAPPAAAAAAAAEPAPDPRTLSTRPALPGVTGVPLPLPAASRVVRLANMLTRSQVLSWGAWLPVPDACPCPPVYLVP